MSTPKEILANLLAEVKLAERKLDRDEAKKGELEAAIKSALRSGDRARAEKLALDYERAKDEVERRKALIAKARAEYEATKGKVKQLESDMKSVQRAKPLADAMEKMNQAFEVAGGAEDVLRKIEEEVAYSEAKLEIANQDAEAHARKAGVFDAEPAPPTRSPDDILEEFEE